MQKVLIVEPHNYHYEVLPGVVHYFYELGYKIYLLVRDKAQIDDAFINVPYKDSIHVDVYCNDELRSRLKDSSIEEFTFIFFNSLEYFHGEDKDRLLDYLGYVPHTKCGIMGIYHNPDMITDADLPLIEENRIFTLSSCSYKNYKLPILSAFYFGEIKKKEEISKKRKALFIGESNDRVKVERTIGEWIKRYKNSNIEIGYIGACNQKKELLSRMFHTLKGNADIRGWRHIIKYGRLSFYQMYKYIGESDFLLFYPNLAGGGKAFLHGKTSGTKQLSIGFLKPCILHEDIAIAFGIPLDACVTFRKTLEEAMRKIDEMKEDDYKLMVGNLETYREAALKESRNNLEHSIILCKKGKAYDVQP